MSINRKLWVAWGVFALMTVIVGIAGGGRLEVYGLAITSGLFGWLAFFTGE